MDLVRTPVAWSIVAVTLALAPTLLSANDGHYCGTRQWQSRITAAATRFGLPERWLHAVMHVESGGCTTMRGSPIVSSAGAMGLMQLMPKTWEAYRQKLELGDDPHNPSDNILAATAYLRDLYDRYGWPGALMAYHAGPTRYDEHLATGASLPGTTVAYVSRVEEVIGGESSADTMNRTLFVAQDDDALSPDDQRDNTRADDLFVDLRHGDRRRKSSEQTPANVQK